VLTQITAITTSVPTPGALIWFLLGMNPLVRVMLRLRRRSVVAVSAFVLPLSRMRGLVVLQLLLGAESPSTRLGRGRIDMCADVCVVLAVCAGYVPVELAAMLEGGITTLPTTHECLGA
jgi:hypothetical protein